ncbi:RNA-binding S4 domain-containing protein [Tessaracoccus flavus]|uniref:RNA-binding protein S4 n=1 Tax=Tessaracoccus flavus TaxID=1610493 RepID=A0A1Q2CII2_9ACTN|nr:S4 domain-containing protein [Tessaracoccus flavus]AQP45917.1 RNA-binding protein S4 [Tessaracoccus flavus]SDZ05721.1 heat shock protein Hsp15 [Tessaracoccus flavus]
MARLDAWLWAVRLYKTRSLATAAVRGGHVRVDDKLAKASQEVVPGQVIRVRRAEHEDRLVEVLDPTLAKRVSAPLAQAAYLDRTPEKRPPIPEMVGRVAVRDRGTGRPTKRERRDIERLRGR